MPLWSGLKGDTNYIASSSAISARPSSGWSCLILVTHAQAALGSLAEVSQRTLTSPPHLHIHHSDMSTLDAVTDAASPTELVASVTSAIESLATAALASATAVADEAQNITLPLGLDGSDVEQSSGNYVVVSGS